MEILQRKKFGMIFLIGVLIIAVGFVSGFFVSRIGGYCPPRGTADVIHYSPFIKPDFYDLAFLVAQKTSIPESETPIRGLTVNHHLLAPHFIARAILTAAKASVKSTIDPSTILLISPNHFNAGNHMVISSRAAWQTPYGMLEPNLTSIDLLAKNGDVFIDEKPFIKEHGIFNIVPFIKKIFPNTTIIPVILKDPLRSDQTEKIADALIAALPKDTLVILSADFSHNHTEAVANAHDKESIAALQNLSIPAVRKLDIDTHPGLEIFLFIMKKMGATNWHLLDHSNAQQIIGHEPEEGVTSYVTGYFSL